MQEEIKLYKVFWSDINISENETFLLDLSSQRSRVLHWQNDVGQQG
jgi:hypothetical protein